MINSLEDKSVPVWIVQWYARYGDFSGETKITAKAFTTKEAAHEFKNHLEYCFHTVQNTVENTSISIKQQ